MRNLKLDAGSLKSRARSLEDSFFVNKDKKLLENLKKMKEMEETIKSLQEVSGIKNKDFLKKLVKLEIPPHVLASLKVIPLVEVAWADGNVDEKEKKVIMEIIKKEKYLGKIDMELLESWISMKPERKLLDAWINYIKGLCSQLSKDESNILGEGILGHLKDVAAASGGFLGIGKISVREQKTIEKLESAFC